MDNTPISNPFDEDQKSNRQSLVWIILIFAVLGCCALLVAAFFFVAFDLDSMVSQFFLTPTLTDNLTATANIARENLSLALDQWPIALSETFDNNDYDWYVGTYDDGLAKTTYEIKEGKYHWAVSAHQSVIEWIEMSPESFSDFFAAIEVENLGSPAYSDYGLTFRQENDSNFYYFGITSDEGFFVSINHKGQWKTLIPYANTAAINATGPNRLSILAQGNHFVFFINDQNVAELTNNQIEAGKIALAIELYNPDDQGTFQFDNISLRTPPPPVTPTRTSRPTPALTLTPTLTTTPHVLITPSDEESIWEDSFDSNAQGWDIYYASDSTVNVQDGRLHFTAETKGYTALAVCRGCTATRNAFYYQAEVLPTEKTNIQHGLAFCLSHNLNEYYTFQVNSRDQSFSLYKRMPNDWAILIGITPSMKVNKYPVSNTLAVLYRQGKITLYLNGALVTTYEDAKPLACEQLGVFVEEGVTEVTVDNLFAYKIKAALATTATP